MKASSMNLEVEIDLTEKESIDLENKSLSGILKFRENFFGKENKRDIPLELKYFSGQKRLVDLTTFPPEKMYLGDAEKAVFTINHEFYENLIEYGKYTARFFSFGKLNVRKN